MTANCCGRRRSPFATTPARRWLIGSTIAFSGSGSGTKAVKIEKAGNAFEGKPLWSNGEVGVQFDTPVVHDGLIFGISDRDRLFCLDAATGKTAWSSELEQSRLWFDRRCRLGESRPRAVGRV